MDKLERRLKEDAEAIDAEISPELAVRIEASLHAAERLPSAGSKRDTTVPLLWISSLTGVAAALLVITILARNSGNSGDSPHVVDEQPTANVVPPSRPLEQRPFPLDAETAELTGPLEEELEKLKSDLEKARDNVERDLRRSF